MAERRPILISLTAVISIISLLRKWRKHSTKQNWKLQFKKRPVLAVPAGAQEIVYHLRKYAYPLTKS